MTPPPRVSIVVPVFNAERFINTAINSVLEQTFLDWELILVDDGSQDNSRAICDSYLDKRIKFISQPNAGPAAARNTGVKNASGEFILFLDADDYLLPNALEILLTIADQNDAINMVLGNFLKLQNGTLHPQPAIFQPNGIPFTGESYLLEGIDLLHYVRHFLTTPSNHLVSYCWARLYRRSMILEHAMVANETMRLFEDFAFNLDVMAKAKKIVFINKPVYVYVMHDAHVSASMVALDAPQLIHDMQLFQQKIESFLVEFECAHALIEQIRREAGHALVHYAIIFLVRTCRQITSQNRPRILSEIRQFIESSTLQRVLSCYQPRTGNSRVLPWLMRLQWAQFLILLCQWKSYRRYGRLKR
ncbi:MAG: glycosyltransferase [Rhodocyclaceae bacterium]|nr:glycosyltransferase [Rhodocyclaceae bacterium]